MALTRIQVPRSFSPQRAIRAVRPGLAPNAPITKAAAANLNFLLGRCLRVNVVGKEVFKGTIRNSSSDLALWRSRYRATPNGTTLVSEVHLLPTDTTAGSPRHYVEVDGVSAGDRTHNRRCTAGAGTFLDDIFVDVQEIAVTADTTHTLELNTDDNCRVVGWYCYEKPRESLTVSTDTVADPSEVQVFGDILDTSVASLLGAADDVWRYMRGGGLNYHVDDPASPFAVTGTGVGAAVNIHESGGSVGVVVPTQYRNSYMNDADGTDTVPVECWVYGARTSVGGSLTVVFSDGTNSTSVTVNGAAGFYTATGNLRVHADGANVKVTAYRDVIGTTGNIFDVGAYPLV